MASRQKNECNGQDVQGQKKGVIVEGSLCLLIEIMCIFEVIEFTTT